MEGLGGVRKSRPISISGAPSLDDCVKGDHPIGRRLSSSMIQTASASFKWGRL